MRHRLFSRVVALVLVSHVVLPATAHAGVRPAACASANVAVTASTVGDARGATLCLLNRERSRHGLAPLRFDVRLDRAAQAHSTDMVRKRYFEHDSPSGRTPFQRMLATHYVPRDASWTLGENIGWGTLELAQPASLVREWMHSPEHRANILNGAYRQIGIGIAIGVPVRSPGLTGQPGATYTTDFGHHS